MQKRLKKNTTSFFVFILSIFMFCSTLSIICSERVSESNSTNEISLKTSKSNYIIKWGWMAGNKTQLVSGVYGIKGTPYYAPYYPGGRYGSASWTDVEGNLWLFGGRYSDSGIKYLNDLWKYDISSGVWAWMAGNDTSNLNGVYGIKGTPDVKNYPGSRQCSFSWSDAEGDLWLFGGYGYAETGGVGRLNDLWKYNISSGVWTWMAGNNTYNLYGVYGIKGTPDAKNYPGSRQRSISWSDAEGDLWLFGGYGYAETGGGDCLNDVWKYNISSGMWTWMAGNKSANANGVYGIKGISDVKNYPGGRGAPTSCIDGEGNLWMFGGYGSAETGIYEWLNDLWKYNITSGVWTWMAGNKTFGVSGVYGTKGIPNIENFPGNREDSVSWMDVEGNLWLFGGWGEDSVSDDNGYYNDLWRYNITSGVWTWMAGNKTFDVNGVYGVKGTPDVNNYPGSRIGAVSWTDKDGDLWLFGGSGSAETGNHGPLNDVWKYNISSGMWTWIAGNKTINANGVYGIKGVFYVTVFPGNREDSSSWMDVEGNLWLFGGWGEDSVSGNSGYYNDLWRYNSSSGVWTWMAGNKTFDVNGVYGVKGTPDVNNYPGSRIGAVSWTDKDGDLWLFGGSGSAETGNHGPLNDVWKYNISSGMWTWMAGNKTAMVNGVYGIKGTPDAKNYPGTRYGSASWTDIDGNLWVFGGHGYAETGGVGYLNDLWKYNISSGLWTWMAGNNTYNLYGVYGIKGTPDVKNYPGSRQCSFSWSDANGDLWLFGGYGYAETVGVKNLNDLWKYNKSSGTWTWMAGNKTYNLNGVYGIKGTPDAKNYPGSRERSISWSDANGDLWLFGGYGYAETGGLVCLNDLWKYNISSGVWTWMAGNKTANANGVYGIKGIPEVKNYPGGRGAPTSCIDVEGNLWLFGGYGSAETGIYDWLNDLWKMEISIESVNPPPSKVTGLTIVSTTETSIYLSWDASSDTDVIMYKFYRNGVNIVNITVLNTSYNDTGLEPGTSYNYQISAVDTFQEGELSDVVTGTTNKDDTGAESIPGYDLLIIMGFIGIILLGKILLRKYPKKELNN